MICTVSSHARALQCIADALFGFWIRWSNTLACGLTCKDIIQIFKQQLCLRNKFFALFNSHRRTQKTRHNHTIKIRATIWNYLWSKTLSQTFRGSFYIHSVLYGILCQKNVRDYDIIWRMCGNALKQLGVYPARFKMYRKASPRNISWTSTVFGVNILFNWRNMFAMKVWEIKDCYCSIIGQWIVLALWRTFSSPHECI